MAEHSEPEVGPDAEQTRRGQGPKTYVDRVVQEILDTERTYVQDLKSIVEVWSHDETSLKHVMLSRFITSQRQLI